MPITSALMPKRLEDRHQREEREEAAGVDTVDLREIVDEGFTFPLHAHVVSPLGSFFGHAELDVDGVLLPVEQEQLHHEDDQRALRRHVVAQRPAEEADVVQRYGEPVHDVGKDEPDDQVARSSGCASAPVLGAVSALS
jgi:hypothetical protein